ncbi:MAG: maltose alpha-D-glucosyltransferase [Sedimentisphaerales bacterium]|nr:maltose alpha-D-glucosyltransferase [Sedimentisphaerales bacterium]
MTAQARKSTESLWYKDAVIYEVHVRSFYDSNNDGIGDFAGLIEKLDYLQELGVTALWLLPFYPSPLRDDGYDIADYFDIHPDYGTLADFKRFLREAHRRDLKVITELVINHTSDQHKWFQKSRRAKPGSRWRDYYVWSDAAEKYKDARVIFTDFETSNWAWDNVAQAYYWHRFYSHQPDLNYDHPRVRQEILRVVDFWFQMGVDGMRLDAVPYLFEREDTNCENLPETHAFLKELRDHVNGKFIDRMLLAEANQWPEDAAAYFGNGDECHMAFHFPIMPRLFVALRMEDRFPVVDMLEQSLDIPETCQWAMFLRNHDELTLEMVTDEERDYMFKAYAEDPRARINVGIRRRLAPLLENSRRRIELMNSLLLSLPGTPIIYYGDEIGMGDNYFIGDRNGVRTPMQWSPDRNAGFSKTNAQKLYLPVIIDSEYHFETINVENQSRNLSSLLWFMRRILAVRRQFKAFGRGRIEFLPSDNTKVLSFLRQYEEKTILVVANLSRYCQAVQIQIPAHVGCSVHDIFSDNRFADITDGPYCVTLAPHSFFWFVLRPPAVTTAPQPEQTPQIQCNVTWARIVGSSDETRVLAVLSDYLKRARWFGGKGRSIRRLRIADSLTVPTPDHPIHILLLEVIFNNAPRQCYIVPIGFANLDQQVRIMHESPSSVIGQAQMKDEQGILYDAVAGEGFRDALLEMIARRHNKKTGHGRLLARRGSKFAQMLADKRLPLVSRALAVEQSNSSVIYDNTFFLKLYRRAEEGTNPDVELSRHLTEHTGFTNLPAFAGAIEWWRSGAAPMTLAMLLQLIPNETDGWSYTLDNVERSFGYAQTLKDKLEELPEAPEGLMGIEPEEIPTLVRDFIGSVYLDMAGLLGRRTAEMHRALASLSRTPDVTAEPFSLLYQKSLYQSMRSLTLKVFAELSEGLGSLDEPTAAAVSRILAEKKTILARLRRVAEKKIRALKMRTHGDYHLGQVLYTGKDFVIIDFEGEPARSLTERRLKHSALRDVAGMVRSLHYAAYGTILLRSAKQGADVSYLERWAHVWYTYVSGVFLHAYIATVGDAGFSPTDEKDFAVLLETFLLEKAVYEAGYELNNRPDWLMIPMRGIEQILKA